MANNVTINGKTYDLSNQADRAQAREDNPGTVVDATSVYNQGTGQETDASSGGGGGGGGGGQSYPGVSSSDLSAIQAGLAASSGMSQKQLDETIREFNANLDWQKQMWTQQGAPQLAIQQAAQTLAEKTEADQTAQAQAQLDWTKNIGQQQQNLAAKTQADANAIAQGQLGLGTLTEAANLTGPQDWIKAANFSRGVANSALPGFVTELLSGQSTAAMGGAAPGQTMSAPTTLGSLAAGMGANVAPVPVAGSVQATLPTFAAGTYNVAGINRNTAVPASTTPVQNFALEGGDISAPMAQPTYASTQYALPTASAVATSPTSGGRSAPVGAYNPTNWQGSIPAWAGQGDFSVTGGMPIMGPSPAAPASPYAAVAPAASGGAGNVDASAAALKALFAQGGQSLGPQALEGLTPTEKSMFEGGGSDVGADVPGFESAYARSRIGQQAALPHYARGGVVTQPQVAMVGERGPEAIVPLARLRLPQFVRVA